MSILTKNSNQYMQELNVDQLQSNITLGREQSISKHNRNALGHRSYQFSEDFLTICNQRLSYDPNSFKVLQTRVSFLLKDGKYQQALEYCNQMIQEQPTNAQGYYFRGCTYEKLEQVQNAIQDLSKAIELDPNHINATLAKAACLNQQGKYNKAFDTYSYALEKDQELAQIRRYQSISPTLSSGSSDIFFTQYSTTNGTMDERISYDDPSSITKLIQLAKSAYSHQEYYDALIYASEALRLEQNWEAAVITALSNSQLLRYAEALETYTLCTKIKPDCADIYYNRGIMCDYLERFQEAVQDYSTAIRINDQRFEFYNNRGLAYLHTDQPRLALQDFDTALRLHPESAGAYANRALCWEKMQKFGLAQNDYTNALMISSEDTDILIQYGKFQYGQGQFSQAFETFGKVVLIDPEAVEGYNGRAGVLLHYGRYSEAQIVLEKCLELDSENTDYRYNLAVCLIHEGNYSKSLKQLAQAISLDPYNFEILYTRATVLIKLERYEEAIADLSTCISDSPSRKYLIARAYCFQLINMHAQALSDYAQCLKINEYDYYALGQLARLYRESGRHIVQNQLIQDF